ncbi:MAG TPA: hypothetical protein VEI96_04365 [Thermodesulfovibrionales bacterium]|nr:hypothetical protein [Thermodesulfovibrionales bacterium]
MNPKIDWCDIKSRRCLVLHFDGHFFKEDAKNAVRKITSMIESMPDKLVMVWECTRMTDSIVVPERHSRSSSKLLSQNWRLYI